MARQVGDLWPHASGTASLGADQLNGPGAGFERELRPFNHIHQNSGIIHDPMTGGSGVFRFVPGPGDVIEFGGDVPVNNGMVAISVDGGINFPLMFGERPDDQIGRAYGGQIRTSDGDPLYLISSGIFLISNSNSPISWQSYGGAITIESDASVKLDSELLTQVSASQTGSVLITAGASHVPGGQITLNAFNGSGILQYRFGPHQSWYIKQTHSSTSGPFGDGYNPLVPSGQIVQMILEEATPIITLQNAYDGGDLIQTTNGLPVHVIGDSNTHGLFLEQTDNEAPHILYSGLLDVVSTSPIPGDFWLQAHTAAFVGQLSPGSTFPTSRAEAAAMSLGPETFYYNSGSGVVALSTCSGIAQFFNASASAAIDENGLIVPIGTKTVAENYFTVQDSSGVRVFVPGLYKITYTAVFRKTNGNLSQQVNTELRIYDTNGNGTKCFGSDSSAICRNSDNLRDDAANGQWVGDLRKGDVLHLFAEHQGSPPADNTIKAKQRASNLIVEWMGPLGGGSQARVAI